MSYFPYANNLHFENCHLVDIANVNMHSTAGVSNDALGIAMLFHNSAITATHNSQARFPPPKCYPETRDAILRKISAWVEEQIDGDRGKRILWIYGPAGAGKSAIAQTIAENFAQQQALAASFFFTRGNDRRGIVNYVILTIAYQLANLVPELRGEIGLTVTRDPSILSLDLEIQIQQLIVKPLASFLSRTNTHRHKRYLIIIDGLDECDGENNQSRFLSLITDLFHIHDLPFTFIIASRPEPHIRNSFRNNPRVSSLTQEFELDPSPEDIRIFLLTSFREMRNSHSGLMSLHEPWPSQKDIDTLVFRSSGYFIYASTVVKFVGHMDMRPTESLEHILSGESKPFSALDDVYHQILLTVPVEKRLILASILEVLVADYRVFGPKPLTKERFIRSWELDELLDLENGKAQLILRRMHSLLRNIDSPDDAIEFHHASFCDFLRAKERSGMFYANTELGHAKIAEAFVRRARLGFLPNKFYHSWSLHARLGRAKINLDLFLEDIQAVQTDTWIYCLAIDEKAFELCEFTSRSEDLERWIDNLEATFYPDQFEIPVNGSSTMMQIFATLLEQAYNYDLESGQLRLIAFFLKETDPAEPIALSIEAGTILLTHKHWYKHMGGTRKTRFLLRDFLFNKSGHEIFPINATAIHEHTFLFCGKMLVGCFASHTGGTFRRNQPPRMDAYARKWWTYHLAQCSPSSKDVLMQLRQINPRITDVHGSARVIDWLKKIPDPPEALISYWVDYQQAIIALSQQARSSSLYPCSEDFISRCEYHQREGEEDEGEDEDEDEDLLDAFYCF